MCLVRMSSRITVLYPFFTSGQLRSEYTSGFGESCIRNSFSVLFLPPLVVGVVVVVVLVLVLVLLLLLLLLRRPSSELPSRWRVDSGADLNADNQELRHFDTRETTSGSTVLGMAHWMEME